MGFLTSAEVRTIRLRDIGPLTERLCDEVSSAGFRPDCVVYMETAARLLAAVACRKFEVGAVGLHIQRVGGTTKRGIAWLLRMLPVCCVDWLRHWEARLLWRRRQHRRIVRDAPRVNLAGRKVLILDDAVDTGESVRRARAWAIENGASAADIRVAALALTTVSGREELNHVLFRQLCRFPWSSDSTEYEAFASAYAAEVLPPFMAPS